MFGVLIIYEHQERFYIIDLEVSVLFLTLVYTFKDLFSELIHCKFPVRSKLL